MNFGIFATLFEFFTEVSAAFLLASRGIRTRKLFIIEKIPEKILPWLLSCLLMPLAFTAGKQTVMPVFMPAVLACFSAILLIVFYESNILKIIIYTSSYWAVIGLCQIFFWWLSVNTAITYQNYYFTEITSYYNYHSIFQLLFSAALWIFYCESVPVKPLKIENRKIWIYMAGLEIILWLTYFLSHSVKKWTTGGSTVLEHLLFIGLFVMAAAYLKTLESYKKASANEKRLEHNYEALKRQYTYIKHLCDEKRRELHDIKHKKMLIEKYLEDNRLSEALSYLNTEILPDSQPSGKKEKLFSEKNKPEIWTGFGDIDYMIERKIKIARQKDIRPDISCSLYRWPLSSDETAVLLGNLLDNAIEAAAAVSDGEKQLILDIKNINRMTKLSLGNSCAKKAVYSDGTFLTGKKEFGSHGIGMKSISEIVKAHDGDMNIDAGEQWFQIEIFFYT